MSENIFMVVGKSKKLEKKTDLTLLEYRYIESDRVSQAWDFLFEKILELRRSRIEEKKLKKLSPTAINNAILCDNQLGIFINL